MPQFDKLRSHAKFSRDFILDLIFPVECLGCGREGAWLCRECFTALDLKSRQYCLHCKTENDSGRFCAECAPAYRLDGIMIAGDYENAAIAKMIKSLKYHFARDIAVILGDYLSLFLKNLMQKTRVTGTDVKNGIIWRKVAGSPSAPEFFFDPSRALVLPVPLHRKRLRWRGFNQSEPIAEKMAKNFRFDFDTRGLIRIAHKMPQAGLSERKRRENILDCFAWQGGRLDGRCVILVDDVVTTGSTLNECAKVLKRHGANEIWGLVVAKG